MGASMLPKGEGEPEVLLSRCSGKSLRDLSRIASGEKTLRHFYVVEVGTVNESFTMFRSSSSLLFSVLFM
jgi:hypothetical protein